MGGVKIDVNGPWFIQPEGRGWRLMASECGGSDLDQRVLMFICCVAHSADEKKISQKPSIIYLFYPNLHPQTYILRSCIKTTIRGEALMQGTV